MKVLLDHCMPRAFGGRLPGHDVRTTYRMGWADIDNGELLVLAGKEFDAFITMDQSLPFQRSSAEAPPLAVVVLCATSNRIDVLSPLAPEVVVLLRGPVDRRVYLIGRPRLSR